MKISTYILSKLQPAQRNFLHQLRRYVFHKKVHPEHQLFILFIDGSMPHGGMADRFKSAVSAFAFCLHYNIPFRLKYTSPFELSDYLVPNEYDWRLRENEKISYNFFEVKYITDRMPDGLIRLRNLKTKKQIHCLFYGDIVNALNNLNNTHYRWGELFKMLFRPTEELKNAIKQYREKIGGDYVCAVFRFQNLLGDFTEYQYTEANEKEKKELIAKCKNALYKLQRRLPGEQKILVTSDSVAFLNAIHDIQHVYAFPEKIVHIDNAPGEAHNVYLKSFIDFYLLSEGKAIYSIGTNQMYNTQFPMYAAKLNHIPFERIIIA